MERKLCGMLIRAVAFWAAFSVRAGEPELSGYSGFCDGDIVKDAVVDFSGLSLHADQLLSYTNNIAVDRQGQKYGAKELTPDLGLNAYDFEARTLTPAFPMFSQPDLMAEKYYPLSPYLYCAGNPINNIDPKGCKIEGVSKDDISFYFTQIKIVLADKKFKPFVDALKIKGKKLEFDKKADVETIVNNLNMTDDESCFIHTLKDAIFNPKTIELEFINDDEIASTKGSDYIRISNTFYRIVKMFNNIFLDAYGKAITVPTNKGAYVLALKNDPNVTSNTFHESLGHGYSLILNLIKSHNENAVRMDNVVRRILKKSQRDGKDHEGEILSPYILPSYQ